MSAHTDQDQQMVEEFMAGAEVPDIASRYAVPEAYVDRVIEGTSYTKPKRGFDWSMNRWGNRLFYSFAAGIVVNLTTQIYVLGTVVFVVLFVITTAIVTTRRR